MAVERERKFLVQSQGWRKQARRGEHYRQGYLSTDPERSIRVRAGAHKAVITIKGPAGHGGGLERSEFEYAIPLDEANQLLDRLCVQPLIEKTRFRLPENGHVWEIDRFEKQNDGLVIAELETHNGERPKHLPRWVGAEVSQDNRFANASLVEHPYSEWRDRAPKPEAKYHWKPSEGIFEGLQRIVSEQVRLAIWQLSENAFSRDESAHEARKSLKKARSAMRLLRGQLGASFDKEYDQANTALREAGRKLSPLRDSQALIEMFDELNEKYREELGDQSLITVREGLVARKKRLELEFERKRTRGTVLKVLRQAATQVGKWNSEQGGFQALSAGFATTIRRNRKAHTDADKQSNPEGFHEWRKRAKDLRHHLGLLGKAWPPVLGGYEQAAEDLEQKLGDDHNLVVLRNTVLKTPDHFGQQVQVKAILDVVDKHQRKLRDECEFLALRLYEDKPGHWRRRIERCWSALQ